MFDENKWVDAQAAAEDLGIIDSCRGCGAIKETEDLFSEDRNGYCETCISDKSNFLDGCEDDFDFELLRPGYLFGRRIF